MSRLFRSVRRGFELIREALDAIDPPEIGTDDEPEQLFDQDDPCLDPNAHAQAGCERCRRTVQAIRDRIICQEILWLGTKEPQR